MVAVLGKGILLLDLGARASLPCCWTCSEQACRAQKHAGTAGGKVAGLPVGSWADSQPQRLWVQVMPVPERQPQPEALGRGKKRGSGRKSSPRASRRARASEQSSQPQ